MEVVTVAVVVAFILCWLPYHSIQLIKMFQWESRENPMLDVHIDNMQSLFYSMAVFNSCLNPVLYMFMGKDFQERVRSSLCRIFENAFREEAANPPVGTEGQMLNLT